MSRTECVAICVGIIGAVALLVSIILIDRISDRIDQFTEVLSQPGIASEVNIERLTITTADGVTIELSEFEADVNSRLIDLLITAASK